MTIRRNAKEWLLRRGVRLAGPLYTSKLYGPSASWTRADAWWIQIPLAQLDKASAIEVVCQSAEGGSGYVHLTVPTRFFRERLDSFGLIGDKSINLFLSAERERLLTDLRGPGRIAFSPFLRSDAS